MTLLIALGIDDWYTGEELRERLLEYVPKADIVVAGEDYDPAAVTMLGCVDLRLDALPPLPNLRLVQKFGAGVETIARDPALPPHVRIARIRPEVAAREIAEYFLTHALARQRHNVKYRADQAARRWDPVPPLEADNTEVLVLGLGHIGGRVARSFASLGYLVTGWARSDKEIEGVTAITGLTTLDAALARADIVAAILPSTPETAGLFGPVRLSRMKPGALFMNAGRGDLVDEAALIAALDEGRPGEAVLDVFASEPLAAEHPFWSHPAITLTPHISGYHITGGLADIAENWRRLEAGAPLLHEVDRTRGY